MAENKKTRGHEEPSALLRFIRTQVDPLSRAFVSMPLARLTVRTPAGSVTFAKAPIAQPARRGGAEATELRTSGEASKPAARHALLVPSQNGEAGRTYVTINAEVVGVFRDAAEPPAPGQALRGDQVLGYIEALRLRNEVRCPMDSVLVAQVVVDGQPVDFGESLFVVDATGTVAAEPQDETADSPSAVADNAEPPRM